MGGSKNVQRDRLSLKKQSRLNAMGRGSYMNIQFQ